MRGIVFLAGALAAGFASAAVSQDIDVTALQMKACTILKDEAARVRCYDRAMSRPASEPTLVAVPSSSNPASAAPLVDIPRTPTVVNSGPAPDTPVVSAPQSPGTPKTESPSFFDIRTIVRAVTPSAVATPTPSAVSSGENWQVKADKLVLQDASRLLATLESSDGKATLGLQCKDRSTEAYVSTQKFLGWESRPVAYRINDNPPIESRWAASVDGRGAVIGDAIEFINSLTDGGILFLRVTDYDEYNHDLRFSLGAMSNLRSQIAVVCRWPGASPEEKLASEQPPPSPRNAKPKPTKPAAIGAPLKLH